MWMNIHTMWLDKHYADLQGEIFASERLNNAMVHEKRRLGYRSAFHTIMREDGGYMVS